MQRIDTASKAVDLFGAGKHGFKDGNVGLGIAATQFNAAICNNVQEEIVRVIEAAGITLNGTVFTQLLSALTAGWGMAKLHASNGYQTLPGGLIIQWGTAGLLSTLTETITLPVAYPNNHFAAFPVDGGSGGPSAFRADTPTLANFTLGKPAAAVNLCYWFSIGN